MEKRIRFGSDGNGVFVIVSVDGGRSWCLFESVADFEALDHHAVLPADEYAAAIGYLRCEWHPGQPLPRAA